MNARILLADDSPHALRMGREILEREGYEVEVAKQGSAVYPLLEEFDPDVVLVDVFLPDRSGYEICHWVKTNPRTTAARVVLTAGMLEPLDEAMANNAGADAILKKPFEPTEVLRLIGLLAEAAHWDRGLFPGLQPRAAAGEANLSGVAPGELDPEKIQEAVACAMQAALPAMIKEVTERVLVALGH